MATITKKSFGTVNGMDNFIYTLSNGKTEVDVMNYGATIVAIRTQSPEGKMCDVVCGYESIEEYQKNGGYLGAVIGRNSNRIANASFELNGKLYELYKNDGNNNLHGGKEGFDMKIWAAEENNGSVIFHYTSLDGECGYPGNATIKVTYSLSDDNALSLEYHGVCDQDTIINLTNHTYFNLNGQESGNIEGHLLKVNSDFYTPVDENCCPTGEVKPVADTVFDFNDFRVVGADINNVPDFDITAGYDHNFILRSRAGQMQHAATAIGDVTGIKMEVYTDKPAIQFYAGNMMDAVAGKNGAMYDKRSGFCLETQVCPNCQNQQHLGSAFVKKGEIYKDTTIFKFIAE